MQGSAPWQRSLPISAPKYLNRLVTRAFSAKYSYKRRASLGLCVVQGWPLVPAHIAIQVGTCRRREFHVAALGVEIHLAGVRPQKLASPYFIDQIIGCGFCVAFCHTAEPAI